MKTNVIELFTKDQKNIIESMPEKRLVTYKKKYFSRDHLSLTGYVCECCWEFQGNSKQEFEKDSSVYLKNYKYIMNILSKYNKRKAS